MADTTQWQVLINLVLAQGSQAVYAKLNRLGSRFKRLDNQIKSLRKSSNAWTRDLNRNLGHSQTKLTQTLRGYNRIARTVVSSGRATSGFGRAVQGGFGHTVMGAARTGAYMGGGAAVAGTLGLAKSGLAINRTFESGQAAVAATLQLFDHSAGAVDQFGTNLSVAKTEFEELFKIAAKSPATLEQTQELYKNMLPGAISATHDMNRIRGMMENALAVGMINGGDYATTGSQLSRIISGGAGAEQETWRALLSHGILEEGIKTGAFSKNQRKGKDLTAAFNALDEGKRLDLVEKTLKRLDDVTEHMASTFEGVTSRVEGATEILRRDFGSPLFDKVKEVFGRWVDDGMEWQGDKKTGKLVKVREGGILDPNGRVMASLSRMMRTLGSGFAYVFESLADKLERLIVYLADNWMTIAMKLADAFDVAYKAAAIFLKVQATRMIVGGGIRGVGGAVTGIGSAASGITNIAGGAAQLGVTFGAMARAAAFALPVILVLAAALAGLGVAATGVVAWWVDKWQEVVDGFATGAIKLGPLFDVLDDLWAKFVAIGDVWMGTTDSIESTNSVILAVTNALHFVTGAFSLFLRVLGYVDIAVTTVKVAFKLWYTAIVGMIKGILDLVNKLPMVHVDTSGIQSHFDNMLMSTGEDMSSIVDNKILQMADTWDKTFANAAERITQTWRDGVQAEIDFRQQQAAFYANPLNMALLANMYGAVARGNKTIEDAKKRAANRGLGGVHIKNLNLTQNLRTNDPDRVISGFNQAIRKGVGKRTAAFPTLPGSV